MVFWYDMSKPVDVYAENFNDWTKYPVNADVAITSTTFTITRFVAENDVVKCYIPSKTKNFPGMKVKELENHPSFLYIIIWVISQTWLSTTP